jgi:hypothetical protein
MEPLLKVYWDYRILDGVGVVKMFYLNGMPFTFDDEDIPIIDEIAETLAKDRPVITHEEIYRGSSYLIEEGLHPLLDAIDLDECSEMPLE